jgi:hypothetical protein
MQSVRHGHLRGRALEEALASYQQIWDQVEALDRECAEESADQERMEIRYDRSVVEDFVANLPGALRSKVRLGRKFLRESLKSIRVIAQENRPRLCPVCRQQLGKLRRNTWPGTVWTSKRATESSPNWGLPKEPGW